MSDKFTFSSAGEIQEVEFALARHGWTHPLLKKATGGEFFGLVLEVLEGRAEICRNERLLTTEAVSAATHIIDCDANPFMPSGLKVYSHTKDGQFAFDAKRVDLYFSEKQKDGNIDGKKFLKELANTLPLNANVLDYLLAHKKLIPKSWKGKYIFFFGTVYSDSSGRRYVRFLYFDDGRWNSDYDWLSSTWSAYSPAAVRAS